MLPVTFDVSAQDTQAAATKTPICEVVSAKWRDV